MMLLITAGIGDGYHFRLLYRPNKLLKTIHPTVIFFILAGMISLHEKSLCKKNSQNESRQEMSGSYFTVKSQEKNTTISCMQKIKLVFCYFNDNYAYSAINKKMLFFLFFYKN